jgi:hypothetical protein
LIAPLGFLDPKNLDLGLREGFEALDEGDEQPRPLAGTELEGFLLEGLEIDFHARKSSTALACHHLFDLSWYPGASSGLCPYWRLMLLRAWRAVSPTTDHRLTLFQTVSSNWRIEALMALAGALVAVIAALGFTPKDALEMWKKE